MIGYRRMKSAGLWKLSRDGYDVIFTRKSFDKETGEEKDSKVIKVTSEEIKRKSAQVLATINSLQEDYEDLEQAKNDIKEQEALVL
jgi:hypothetical protein